MNRKTRIALVAATAMASASLWSDKAAAVTNTDANATWTTDLNGYYGGTAFDTSWVGDSYNGGQPTSNAYTGPNGSSVTVTSTFRGGNFGQGVLNPDGTYSTRLSELYLQAYNQTNGSGLLTLNLTTPQAYFGAILNTYAGGTSSIAFYSGNALLENIDTTALGTSITTGIGQAYSTYLNVTMRNGAKFDKVVISETGGLTDPVKAYYNEVATFNIMTSSNALGNVVTQGTADIPEPGAALAAATMGILAAAATSKTLRRKSRKTA